MRERPSSRWVIAAAAIVIVGFGVGLGGYAGGWVYDRPPPRPDRPS
jgi:hypothetical protein